MSNPKDATAASLKKLRSEVKVLIRMFNNEVRYSDKKFKELDKLIYYLQFFIHPDNMSGKKKK